MISVKKMFAPTAATEGLKEIVRGSGLLVLSTWSVPTAPQKIPPVAEADHVVAEPRLPVIELLYNPLLNPLKFSVADWVCPAAPTAALKVAKEV